MRETKSIPRQKTLNRLLDYDPDTGALFWRVRPTWLFGGDVPASSAAYWNRRFAGKPAFTAHMSTGYLNGRLLGTHYLAHRVIWVLVHGDQPLFIDHINGIRDDNRVVNLRSVTRAQNQKNQKLFCTNTSGAAGVSWLKREGVWRAAIARDKLGLFASKADAIAARKAEEVRRGYHPLHGTDKTPEQVR